MKFKIDENLPSRWAAELRSADHDALSVLDQGMGGRPDDDLASLCVVENRILITLDTDFCNILRYPSDSHPGIIVIRTPDQSIPILEKLLRDVLNTLKAEPIDRKLWIVELDRIRIRGDS